MAKSFLTMGIAALASWLLLALLVPALRKSLLDLPNARSSHRVPTPRGGGIAFVLVGTALSLMEGSGPQKWIPLMCCPLAVVGMLDDRFDLPAGVRYGVQLLTGAGLLAVARTPMPFWMLPFALIAVTAVINFMNFMDGLDGLVAGSSVVLMAAAGQWPIVGALLGFLLWNWSPARVFMGDVGSTFLGAAFSGMVLQQPTASGAMGLLLVGIPILGDAFLCLLRRLAQGQNVFQAHRLHLYQRLNQAGWPHARVAGLYGGSCAVLALAWVLGGLPVLLAVGGLVLLLGAWLDGVAAVRFGSDSGQQA